MTALSSQDLDWLKAAADGDLSYGPPWFFCDDVQVLDHEAQQIRNLMFRGLLVMVHGGKVKPTPVGEQWLKVAR